MSVQKKSLIGRAPQKKATTKQVKETGVGESKALTASAMRSRSFKAPKVTVYKAAKKALR